MYGVTIACAARRDALSKITVACPFRRKYILPVTGSSGGSFMKKVAP